MVNITSCKVKILNKTLNTSLLDKAMSFCLHILIFLIVLGYFLILFLLKLFTFTYLKILFECTYDLCTTDFRWRIENRNRKEEQKIGMANKTNKYVV